MANFAASIRDTNGDVAVTSNGSVISITDYSNYDTNNESGHLQADFKDFRKIKFINPDNTSYLFSSLGDGNEVTIPANGATLPIQDLYAYSTGDGVYTVILYTVPTWKKDGVYSHTTSDHVYYNGVVYKALLNPTSGTPGTDPTKWQVLSNIDLLPVKYRVEEQFSVICSLLTCFAQKVAIVNCTAVDCNWANLPKDQTWAQLIQLSMIIEAVPYLVENESWSQIENIINKGKEICCCSSN